jgi:hypothetical protein
MRSATPHAYKGKALRSLIKGHLIFCLAPFDTLAINTTSSSAIFDPPIIRIATPMPGKVRTCCLYKYPSWIQDLIVSSQQQQDPQKPNQPSSNNYSPSDKSQRSATTTTITSGQRWVLSVWPIDLGTILVLCLLLCIKIRFYTNN